MLCRTMVSSGIARFVVSCSLAFTAAALWSPRASADPISAGDGSVFRLNPESRYEQGCYDPCLCPLMVRTGARGTLKLVYAGFDGVLHTYTVEDVNWTVPSSDDPHAGLRIIGSGTYQIGSPDPITVVQHRMTLDLEIGDAETQHFDSGWHPIEDMSKIAITVSINGMYCWDTAIILDASPVPDDQIFPYVLTSDSTFQRGCFDPCDCILEPQRPMIGTFKLVPLMESLPLTEFAVVDLSWHVLFSAAGESNPITGVGVYQLLGDFALQHRLVLDLIVGDEARTHFDSGPNFGGDLFPKIDAVVSVNGIYCFDTVLHVVADRVAGTTCSAAGDACAVGEFCKLPVGDCTNDTAGACTPIPTGCPDVWDPVCGCDGVTYGNECEADAASMSVAHVGECGVVCRPADDSFGCVPLACSDIPEEQCIGTVLHMNLADGAITTLACTCMNFNDCHVEFGNATPFGVGDCPAGTSCEVFGVDTDGDGIDDQFWAECVGAGACCSDIGGSPLPVPVCTEVPPSNCVGVGFFKGYGTTCDPIEACCLPLGDQPYCHDTDPFCCASFGGVAGGTGSMCSAIACGPACGGIAGIPCPDAGAFCKFPEGTCHWADMLGVCTPSPTGCPDVWDPVCGCDGVTYGNACEADTAGVSIDRRGECARVCGGLGPHPPCDDGQFCKYADGVCGDGAFQGVCMPIPDACLAVWEPVCGCDGVTYSNECDASTAGASVAFAGECPWVCCDPGAAPPCLEEPYCCADGNWSCGDGGGPNCTAPGIVCGPVCGGISGMPCYDADAFCKFPEGICGAVDFFGMCTPVPNNGCPEIYDPVCGCDGITYGNECEANTARVSIMHRGPCERPCSEDLGMMPCGPDMFCLFPEGTCDGDGYLGLCTPIPDACPAVSDPVCGCDGVTYGNECEANMAGISVRHHGECERICNAPGAPPCEAGEFCKFPVGACGDPTASGVCAVIPVNCTEQYDPVCGCDGVTYGNACMADAASVSIAHTGECAGTPCAATRSFSNVDGLFCPQVPQMVQISLTPPATTEVVAVEDAPPNGWVVGNISHDGTFDAANGKVKWGPFFAPSVPAAVTYEITPADDTTGVACFSGTVSLDGINEQVCGNACINLSCPPFMAADIPQPVCASCPIGDCTSCPNGTCRDGRITMCELIGYACAWKVGCNDDLAGMARAAYLWRHGECYCWDETTANWAPSACPPPASGVCGGSGGRGDSVDGATGGSVVIQVDEFLGRTSTSKRGIQIRAEIEAPKGASVMAAEVQVPKGWKVAAISDGGDWESAHRKVKWGPFFDRLSRTLTFTVIRPEAQRRLSVRKQVGIAPYGRFVGTVSFDGINEPLVIR